MEASMKTFHTIAYFNSKETLSEEDVQHSMSILKKKIEDESAIRMTFETRPECEDHEKDACETTKDGDLITGIRRPPRAKKEHLGDRVSASFSRTLSAKGSGGLRDFCIRSDQAFHAPTLLHELLHALGFNPDNRETTPYDGKEKDDRIIDDDYRNWHAIFLRQAEADRFHIPLIVLDPLDSELWRLGPLMDA
jgi:hypothetical protein